jgi:2-polyprenyl-6-methoxyphenol hydroxylase-like FAD-dependent oxidoreductase
MWAFGARREKFGLGSSDVEAIAGEGLRTIVLDAMASRRWDERFRNLVRLADPETINAITIRTATPAAPWPTRRITLLGDAIHAMTPYRGIGANVALKDAVRLCRALVAAERRETPLIDAIHDYEAGMIDYGFRAVRMSLQAMQQAMPDSAMSQLASRAFLRRVNNDEACHVQQHGRRIDAASRRGQGCSLPAPLALNWMRSGAAAR